MTNAEFKVSGMHCPSCNMLVEDVLGDEDGVESVKADFEAGNVEVEFDENKINIDKLKSLIEEEGGYKVTGVE